MSIDTPRTSEADCTQGPTRRRLSELDAAAFHRDHVQPGLPVHLTESINGWKAHRWTEPYLRSVLAHKTVKVYYNAKSTFDFNASATTGYVTRRTMPFADALNHMHSDKGGNFYLQQQDIAREFPELLPDIERPALLDAANTIEVTNIWMGGKGCKSPLHFDRSDNFLVQVKGRKLVTLFPPSQSANLYPAIGDVLAHCSRVNVFDPDLAAHPLYRDARPHMLQVLLQAGDTLYIPTGWWHAVESLEASISVNFWWRRSP